MAESEVPTARTRRALLIKLGLAGFVLGAVAVLLLRESDPKALLIEVMEIIRSLGPGMFFVAMAVLPSFGCPITVFTLSAGPVFGAQLGLPLILALAAASIAFNLALSYWIARQALRPWIEWLFTKLGYRLPQVATEDHLALTVLVRVTPGPPFIMQSYLLSLAGVSFGVYMAISWVITSAYAFAMIIFGDALAQGRGKNAFIAVSLFIALTVGVHFVRRHFARRRAANALTQQSDNPGP